VATYTKNIVLCDHCGAECRTTDIQAGDKHFCCQGCKTVYELLEDNELCTYYALEDHPGSTIESHPDDDRFEFLNYPDIKNKLIEFEDDDISVVTFFIPSIHCKSCIWLLENLHRLSEGVEHARVDFIRREVSVTFHPDDLSLGGLVKLLASIGYEPQINLDNIDKKERDHSTRSLYMKLGVAGFAFGNIMLYSLPSYLAHRPLSPEFQHIFNLLNIVLALPVLFFSSSDYLKSAGIALSKLRINMDVPISLGILVLFSRSIYEIATGIGTGYMDSFTGLVFFLLIGKLFQKKTYDNLSFDRDYRSYFPLSVKIKKEEDTETVPVSSLDIGDTMLLRNHELVPADSELTSDNTLVDFSFVTGESTPIEKKRGDLIYAGGRIIGQAVEMIVSKEVSQGYLTRLWNNEIFHSNSPDKDLSTITDDASVYFTLGVIFTAVISGLYWMHVSTAIAINTFTSVLIIACPCALALAAPFTLGSAMNIYGRSGFFIKNANIIERLSRIRSIVFDKTGTLTESNQSNVDWVGNSISGYESTIIASVLNNSTHPLSKEIALKLSNGESLSLEKFEEYTGLGISANIDGHSVLAGSRKWLLKNNISVETSGRPSQTEVHIAFDNRYKGYFLLKKSYRKGLKILFHDLQKRFELSLLSGDNDAEKKNLIPLFGSDRRLHFNQSPEDKLVYITNLQSKGNRVIMLGDGLNDAGALKKSDVGVAVSDDVGSFSPACDAILDANRIQTLPTYLKFARSSMIIIFISYTISLLYNLIGLGFAVQGMISPLLSAVLMPLSSITIILFTTTSTHLTAKKMGLSSWK